MAVSLNYCPLPTFIWTFFFLPSFAFIHLDLLPFFRHKKGQPYEHFQSAVCCAYGAGHGGLHNAMKKRIHVQSTEHYMLCYQRIYDFEMVNTDEDMSYVCAYVRTCVCVCVGVCVCVFV